MEYRKVPHAYGRFATFLTQKDCTCIFITWYIATSPHQRGRTLINPAPHNNHLREQMYGKVYHSRPPGVYHKFRLCYELLAVSFIFLFIQCLYNHVILMTKISLSYAFKWHAYSSIACLFVCSSVHAHRWPVVAIWVIRISFLLHPFHVMMTVTIVESCFDKSLDMFSCATSHMKAYSCLPQIFLDGLLRLFWMLSAGCITIIVWQPSMPHSSSYRQPPATRCHVTPWTRTPHTTGMLPVMEARIYDMCWRSVSGGKCSNISPRT